MNIYVLMLKKNITPLEFGYTKMIETMDFTNGFYKCIIKQY